MDELLRKHALEARMTAGKVAQLGKPKLGQKPLSAEALAAQSARLLTDLAARHETELAELTQRLAALDVAAAGAGAPAALEQQAASPPPPPAPQGDGGAAAATSALSPAPVAREPPAAAAAPVVATQPAAPPAGAVAAAPVDASGKKKSRKDRRKDKKAAEREAGGSDSDADAEAPRGPDPKEVEISAIMSQLAPKGLALKHVPADGNCLFRAISDQLLLLAGAKTAVPDHQSLRVRAAEHIRAHADAFAAFLPYETGDGYPEGLQPDAAQVRRAVERYCARMATSSAWGGHPELRALSCTLGLPLVVYQAGAPPLEITPEVESMLGGGGSRGGGGRAGDDDDSGYRAALQQPSSLLMGDASLRLQLSFHRSYYTLGEHYNSVVSSAASGAGATLGAGGWATPSVAKR